MPFGKLERRLGDTIITDIEKMVLLYGLCGSLRSSDYGYEG